jgi:hypothetical protein
MLAPLVIVIQPTVLTAVHAQLDPVITVMLPTPPVDGTEMFVGETEYEHCAYAGRGAMASPARINARSTPDRTISEGPPQRPETGAGTSTGRPKAALAGGGSRLGHCTTHARPGAAKSLFSSRFRWAFPVPFSNL